MRVCCKKGEMGNQERHDRLSDLPLNVISEILARVPTRDAIRTSLLSRQWKSIWTTLPRLLFSSDDDDDDLNNLDIQLKKELGKSMTRFISNVLVRHEGPIHSFETSDPFSFSTDTVEEWILYLSRNDIRELIIKIDWFSVPYRDANLLKVGIYSCAKLTKLKLSYFTVAPPPSTFKGFLFLTSLVLDGVNLSADGVESLVANCPILEKLKIWGSSSRELRLYSPNLKNLNIYDDYMKLCLHAPLLSDLFVILTMSNFSPLDERSVSNYSNFFNGSTNLVNLIGQGYFIKYLSIGIDCCRRTIPFHHLEAIYLCGVDFRHTKQIATIARLIFGAPNLLKLDILTEPRYGKEGAPSPPYSSLSDYRWPRNFKLKKLRVVSLSSVCNYQLGIHLVKFLLKSSPVLETLDLGEIHKETSLKLLGFRRSSPNARILASLID